VRFKKPKLKFALDEGVPNAVGRILEELGHKATYLNKGDSVPRGSTDNLVCAFAVISEKILVALDGDMKGIAKAHGASNSIYSKLNLVKLSCTPPEAAARLKVAMSLIEHEWHVNAGSEGRRLYVEVLTTVIRTMR
jgi:predicted nuclease of predicted toxin-antitoxin system